MRLLTTSRQLQTGKGTGAESYNGMVDCFRKIVKHEGYEHATAINYPSLALTRVQLLPSLSRNFRANSDGGTKASDQIRSQ